MYAPSQWETALQRNAISHRLGAYTEWSLNNQHLAHISSILLSWRKSSKDWFGFKLKLVINCPNDNKSSLVQGMAWVGMKWFTTVLGFNWKFDPLTLVNWFRVSFSNLQLCDNMVWGGCCIWTFWVEKKCKMQINQWIVVVHYQSSVLVLINLHGCFY